MNNIQDDWPIGEDAEARKKRFLQLVEQLAHLRDLQYGKNCAQKTIEHAKKVAAHNLPLNVIRASAIIVDYFYGFPPNWGEFVNPPEWVLRQHHPTGVIQKVIRSQTRSSGAHRCNGSSLRQSRLLGAVGSWFAAGGQSGKSSASNFASRRSVPKGQRVQALNIAAFNSIIL